MTFPDHFSSVATQYAASRPRYPRALFAYLAGRAPQARLAWDAGCGSGQAALGLAEHFAQVVATDASAAQLASAPARDNITYRVTGEADARLADRSVDLVTVAQAVHWFDRPTFWREVNRVLVPDGVLAVWSYNLGSVSAEIDAALRRWHGEVLNAWWPPERALVEAEYRDIGFPYAREIVPAFRMSQYWTRAQFVDYLRTWSAVTSLNRGTGGDAVALIAPELEARWPGDGPCEVVWPLTLIVGARPS